MVAAHANLLDSLLHQFTQLDPMVYFMVVVVTVAFAISALVLVEMFPRADTQVSTPPTETAETDLEGTTVTNLEADGTHVSP